MATSNFMYDEVLGIIVLNVYDYVKREVEFHRIEEGIEDYDESDVEYDWYYDDWMWEIKELNKKLNVLEVSLESGYYDGAQLRVEYRNNSILTHNELSGLIAHRNDKKMLTYLCRELDCRYWDISPSKIFKDYSIIVEWVNSNLKCEALLNLGVSARFSNGETWYSKSNELLEA